MKATGIIRKMDNLGRIVLPMELRKVLDITEGDGIEIFTDGDKIILKKHNVSCNLCDNDDMEELIDFNGKKICTSCINELAHKKFYDTAGIIK